MQETLVMIKPDGLGRVGRIQERFMRNGLLVKSRVYMRLTRHQAGALKGNVKGPRLQQSLVDYLTSGKVCVLILEGRSAIKKVRALVGNANPAKAAPGTIRGDYAHGDMESLAQEGKAVRNVIHSSDSAESYRRERGILLTTTGVGHND